jgi:hypothetical protein
MRSIFSCSINNTEISSESLIEGFSNCLNWDIFSAIFFNASDFCEEIFTLVTLTRITKNVKTIIPIKTAYKKVPFNISGIKSEYFDDELASLPIIVYKASILTQIGITTERIVVKIREKKKKSSYNLRPCDFSNGRIFNGIDLVKIIVVITDMNTKYPKMNPIMKNNIKKMKKNALK